MYSIDRKWKFSSAAVIAVSVVVLLAATARPVQAQTVTVLHEFAGAPDGYYAYSGVFLKGSIYGTTRDGGSESGTGPEGYGIVYKITTKGKQTILHRFTGKPDGANPYGGVVRDKQGNLYGMTQSGGSNNSGIIYKIAKNGTETILHNFTGATNDGQYPKYGGLTLDTLGNLYGTTVGGGTYGVGVVFKLAPDGTFTVLHSFNSTNGDGYSPVSGVAFDKKGNLYGTTSTGGAYNYGIVFKITSSGTYSVLHNFAGGTADGIAPYGTPVFDKKGNLYGTTETGGAYSLGTAYKIAVDGTYTILHNFAGYPDGWGVYAGLVMDKLGNFYGTAAGGGAYGGGIVFKLAPDGTETIVLNFNGTNGMSPTGNVALDAKGNIYSSALSGGKYNAGTVVKITP